MRGSFRISIFGLVLSGVLGCAASMEAQVATTPVPARRPATPPRPVEPVVVLNVTTAPQVVTILHRLNGLKLFRLMARENQQLLAIAQLDEAFKIMDDVHTTVIAGLALNDGQTIVARLPEVEAELGSPQIPYASDAPLSFARLAANTPKATSPLASNQLLGPNDLWEEPDVTVIARDGRHFSARYVGLDGVTGLSILKLADRSSLPAIQPKIETINIGQHLRLLGPEPIAPKPMGGRIAVRVGEIEGTVTKVTAAPSGGVSKMKIKSARLTPANIGGIAVDDSGETVGIVDNIEKDEASILSAAQISNAARRVLARHASVPRPWVGVTGEPIATLATDNLLSSGWPQREASALTQDGCGILVTSVAPNSPAAVAALKSGDIILRVNGEDIRSADDFSWFLADAGAGNAVNFTVMRKDQKQTDTVNLKLSGAFTPGFSTKMVRGTRPYLKQSFLIRQGIETVALLPAVASRFGISEGLLVIYVQPETESFKAGLRPGDVIETINGKKVSNGLTGFTTMPETPIKFNVIRRKQKLTFTVDALPK